MEHLAIDLGGKESQICVRRSDGQIVEERRCQTANLPAYLATRPRSRVVVETCGEALALADAALGLAVHLGEQMGELSFRKVAEQRMRGLLHGNGQRAMTRQSVLRMVVEDVPEETVNRRQARIAGPYRIAPRRFEVREKLQDRIWSQILDL